MEDVVKVGSVLSGLVNFETEIVEDNVSLQFLPSLKYAWSIMGLVDDGGNAKVNQFYIYGPNGEEFFNTDMTITAIASKRVARVLDEVENKYDRCSLLPDGSNAEEYNTFVKQAGRRVEEGISFVVGVLVGEKTFIAELELYKTLKSAFAYLLNTNKLKDAKGLLVPNNLTGIMAKSKKGFSYPDKKRTASITKPVELTQEQIQALAYASETIYPEAIKDWATNA